IVALVAVAPAARPTDNPQPATPARKLAALVKEYKVARQTYLKATNDGDTLKTPRDQLKKASEAFKQQTERCAAGCLELAEKHPDDPAALDALIWVLSHTTVNAVPDNAPLSRAHDQAVSLLRRDHLGSQKLGAVCRLPGMCIIQDPESVKFVEA